MLVARILAFDQRQKDEHITHNAELMALGMDSLMALELRRQLEKDLQVSLRSTLVFEYPTISAMVTHLMQKISAQSMNPELDESHIRNNSPQTEVIGENVLDELSPEALELILEQELDTAI